MDKCLNCQFYDRKRDKAAESRALQWGQCRRTAPMLNPTTAKSYMIEGVWPTVRDDDWCGEWKLMTRRSDVRLTETLTTTTNGASTSPAMARLAPLNGGATTAPGSGTGGVLSGPMATAGIGAD